MVVTHKEEKVNENLPNDVVTYCEIFMIGSTQKLVSVISEENVLYLLNVRFHCYYAESFSCVIHILSVKIIKPY